MIINFTFDSSVNSAPAGFVASLNAVAQYLESQFTNPITINIDVGYGEVDGHILEQGALGESETFLNQYSYSQVRNALIANAVSPDQISAANSLPASDPTPGGSGHYWVSTAEAKAIGLSGASSANDGFVGFASTNQNVKFTYNTTNGGPVASGTYDFFGVAAHEITEVLGRALLVGGTIGTTGNSYEPLDLFHYSGPGKPIFSGTTAGYFSPDAGASNLDNFNTNTGGDFGDWAASAGNDAFLAFSNSGVPNPVSAADLREMNVLGYDIQGAFIASTGDLNADGYGDIAVQNSATGALAVWQMNNGTIPPSGTALPNPGPSWQLKATGDFNGDKTSDLLWQNVNGSAAIWEMNGSSIITAAVLPNPGPSWHAITTGDFNGDGHADIIWQNADGLPAIWMMNGTNIVGTGLLPNPGTSWHVAATGDFNGGGTDDILWQNANGTPAIWEMNGTSIVGTGLLANPGAAWHAVGTFDFNGDGHADILWQNSDGTPAIWLMNGVTVLSGNVLPNPGQGWQLAGAGPFNHTAGKGELLFVNSGTGGVELWTMNGTQVSSMTQSGSVASAAAAAPLSSSPVLSDPTVAHLLAHG